MNVSSFVTRFRSSGDEKKKLLIKTFNELGEQRMKVISQMRAVANVATTEVRVCEERMARGSKRRSAATMRCKEEAPPEQLPSDSLSLPRRGNFLVGNAGLTS